MKQRAPPLLARKRDRPVTVVSLQRKHDSEVARSNVCSHYSFHQPHTLSYRIEVNYFSDLCSLNQPGRSFKVYAECMSPMSPSVPRKHRSPSPPTDQEVTAGDRVEGLSNFGKPTGNSARLSKQTKMTPSSNGMVTVA